MGTLRRSRWTNCPIPMDAVSPSPLIPTERMVLLASSAPVATDGMRPWTALKPKERDMKYAGDLEEQPIPLIFITRSGLTPIS